MNRLLLPVAAVLLAAGSADAQEQQRSIDPGELTRGTLSADDPQLPTDSHYDEYFFNGRRGETVVVSMESEAFDAFLHLGVMRYGRYQELATDDDGGAGDGNNSRIELRLPEDGAYVIRASSVVEATGVYTLSLAGGRALGPGQGMGPEVAGEGRGAASGAGPGEYALTGVVEAGWRVENELSASDPPRGRREPFHAYAYYGRRGERLTITARSIDFDAYLVLGTPGGGYGMRRPLGRNDNGGGGRDARIVHTFREDGEYEIRVNAKGAGTGSYTLEVESSLGDRGGHP